MKRLFGTALVALCFVSTASAQLRVIAPMLDPSSDSATAKAALETNVMHALGDLRSDNAADNLSAGQTAPQPQTANAFVYPYAYTKNGVQDGRTIYLVGLSNAQPTKQPVMIKLEDLAGGNARRIGKLVMGYSTIQADGETTLVPDAFFGVGTNPVKTFGPKHISFNGVDVKGKPIFAQTTTMTPYIVGAHACNNSGLATIGFALWGYTPDSPIDYQATYTVREGNYYVSGAWATTYSPLPSPVWVWHFADSGIYASSHAGVQQIGVVIDAFNRETDAIWLPLPATIGELPPCDCTRVPCKG